MRLIDVAEFYSPTGGGVRSYIDRKFAAAAALGHELFVLAPAAVDRVEPRPGGGGLVLIRSPQLPMDPNYHVFWDAEPVHRWLDRLAPDIVEASSPWRGAWIVASWDGPARRAMFVHADPVASYPHRWFAPLLGPDRVDRLFEWFWAYLRRLAGQFDSVVVGGAWLGERLRGHGIAGVTSVPLGIDRSVFTPALRDESLRVSLLAACGLPASARLLLGVGRFHPEKRWPMVIAAASAARATAPAGLVLVGDGLDRGRVARAAQGDPHVQIRPPIRDRRQLATLLASADALVHGCECETFGLIPAEALASGLPLVLPDRGGAAQLADPAISETYRAADGTSAAAALQRLLLREPGTLKAAAVAAATRVRSDADHFAQLFDFYAGLAGGAAPALASQAA